MVEVPSDGINAAIYGRGKAALWHQRLGHMSEKGMKILASKSRIPNLQKVVVGFCEPCVLRKQKKVSFVKHGNKRKLQRLELVHTDVYGPTSVASIGGSCYYVTFIDYSSRKVWVYFLKNKSEVFNTFKKWKAAVENETNLRVKCLKFDNGGGYSSRVFIEYCVENGIRMLKTAMAQMRWDIAFGISKSHKVVRSRDVTFNEDSLYGAKATTDSSNLTKPNQKDQVVLEDSSENLANKSIVKEHGLSSEITQIPCESSDMSEGSENSRILEDSGRSDEKDSKDRASSEEGGFETLRLRRYTRESRALVRLPTGKKALQSKWVFKVKEEQDGKKRFKARLVVKGFILKQGVDYNEIFSPVVNMTTIRLVLSIVAAENLHLEKLDVKTSFLHSDLDEDIYVTQPEGFQSTGKEEKLMCKLKKSLYGLKQAPRQWYLKFDSFMQRAWYKRCAMDHCCYLKKVGSSSIILLLYVDDMLVAGSDMAEIKKHKRQLSQEFKMKDLGKVLEKFNMKDAEARCQPLGDHFKLNIAHVVGVVSRFMSNSGREHWEAVKWLLHYLKGTLKATLCFSKKEVVLEGFSDLDYRGCLDLEAEYMAIAEAGKELVWLKNFLEELDRAQTDEGTLSLKKILGAKNPADMLTKVVTTKKLKLYAASTGLRDN
ncbi:retrovirus-related pol polyprotein from transposon TNT 1-94 [Tanacetum coccineum]